MIWREHGSLLKKSQVPKKMSVILFPKRLVVKSKIPHLLISFELFLHGDYPSLKDKPITDDELTEALQTWKAKKSSGYDEISSDVIKHV